VIFGNQEFDVLLLQPRHDRVAEFAGKLDQFLCVLLRGAAGVIVCHRVALDTTGIEVFRIRYWPIAASSSSVPFTNSFGAARTEVRS